MGAQSGDQHLLQPDDQIDGGYIAPIHLEKE
jgi:hypothetical protein